MVDQSKLNIDFVWSWGIWYWGIRSLGWFLSNIYYTLNILRNEEFVPNAKYCPLGENWQVLMALGSEIVASFSIFFGF